VGIFERLRRAAGSDGPPPAVAAPGPAAEPEPTAGGDDGVIRAARTEWSRLPPLQPVIGEMPLLVPSSEASLVSHRAPERYLADLGHFVTDDAPAGLVQAVAVLAPPEAEEVTSGTPEPEPALVLAPVTGPSRARDDEIIVARRTDPRMEPGPARVEVVPAGSAEPLTLALVQPEPAPATQVEAEMPADLPLLPLPSFPLPEEWKLPSAAPSGEEPAAGLVGGRDGRAALEPTDAADLDQMNPPAAWHQPSGEAGDLPLVPARRGAEPGPGEPPGPDPNGYRSAGSVRTGETGTPAGPNPPAASIAPVDARGVEAGTTPGGGGSDPVAGADLTAGTGPVAAPAAPLLGRADPLTAIAGGVDPAGPAGPETHASPGEGEPGGGDASGSGSGGSPDAAALPLAVPTASEPALTEPALTGPALVDPALDGGQPPDGPAASGTAGAGPAPVATAPLVGAGERLAPGLGAQAEPDAAEALDPPAGDGPAPRARRGLGEPMAGLPPTARPYDLTRLSDAERREMARALIAARLGPAGGFPPPRPEAPVGPLPLARPGPVPQDEVPHLPAGAGRLVAARPGPPAVAGTAPDGLAVEVEGVAALVAFREPIDPAEPEAAPPGEGASVRAEVGMAYGLDLDEVPVDRSRAGALAAHQAGARAFTTESGIVIPAEAGSLDGGPGAALLAHELTHVAQRRLGGDAPDEDSPAGRALEAEARRNELVYAAGRQLPAGLPAPAPASAAPWPVVRPRHPAGGGMAVSGGTAAAEAAPPAVPATLHPGGPLSRLPLAGVSVGPDAEAIAQSVLERVGPLLPTTAARSEVFGSPVTAGLQRASAEVEPGPPQAGQGEPPAPPSAPLPRPSDADLDNLSRWLYPLIRFRLRKELREDRERAGLLTEHYRRW
jgi:hypothetical protein